MEIQLQISGTEGLLETGVEDVPILNAATNETENIIKLTPTVSKFFLSVSQDDPPSASEGNTTQLNIVYHTRSMTGLWRQGISNVCVKTKCSVSTKFLFFKIWLL